MSHSDGSGQSLFFRKIGRIRHMRKELKRNVFISLQIRCFWFVNIKIQVLFLTFYTDLATNTFVFSQRKGTNRRNEQTVFEKINCADGTSCNKIDNITQICFFEIEMGKRNFIQSQKLLAIFHFN